MARFRRGYDLRYEAAPPPFPARWRRRYGRRYGGDLRRVYGRDYRGRTADPDRSAGWGWGSYRRALGDGYGREYYALGNRGRPYKSRWQTDYGDPFADRQRHTPIRVVDREPAYERHNAAARYGYGYDYDYDVSRYPMGYLPYGLRVRKGRAPSR